MRSLVFASIFIALVAVSVPSIFTRYMDSPRRAVATHAPDAVELGPAEAQSSGPRQVRIDAESDGHFYVEAQINFRPVRLVVDTGATVVALRESDAAAAGIRLRHADFTHPVQTANGTTSAAAALLQSVAVDDIELRNIRALVIPDDQLSISLLGGSFLQGLDRFEIADGTLILEE